ncbi:hypothetical protein VB780_12125 [Leptolyngbya sp. CCNP1308]|uniref:hypothetical protein n=1 Tax=Leptolyngbya sp. CCNP1308 TaxID=3110255 RepID=UPI002B21D55C|nr:hypothetical protein [Leptolyngbya sp. CCNP1308]MEA5449320.1 hypothetical protein [Leptolyngbya sp. CCNP1308]
MTTPDTPGDNRSVQIGGSVTGSAVVTGDSNTVSVQFQQASLPAPETVDIQAEIEALKDIFASLNNPTITGAAEEMAQEVAKPEPDKEIIADALETGLKRIQKLADFGDVIDKLRPHIEATAGWLGMHGHKLLPLVGLAL